MINPIRLDPDRAMLLVIDIQEKLLPLIDGRERIVNRSRTLLQGAKLFDLPILVTEQYPKGIGQTVPELANVLATTSAERLEKTTFSCCGDDAIRSALRRIDRDQIIICGIEAHVCVQQTALDLLMMDYQVNICADAAGSRTQLDYDVAMERMRHAGAHVTTAESVLFELCNACGTERFKKMLELIKGDQ